MGIEWSSYSSVFNNRYNDIGQGQNIKLAIKDALSNMKSLGFDVNKNVKIETEDKSIIEFIQFYKVDNIEEYKKDEDINLTGLASWYYIKCHYLNDGERKKMFY